ncbi:MAG: lytic transglycosylase domain-containing protein [Syntrophales bacterium]
MPAKRTTDRLSSPGGESCLPCRRQTASALYLAGMIFMTGFFATAQIPALSSPDPVPEKKSGKQAPGSMKRSLTGKKGAAYGPQSYAHIVRAVSARHGLKPEWVQAIIDVESGGDPFSVSRSGAMGLMQLMPHVCREYNVADPFNARENIRAGAAYFAGLFRRAEGNLEMALAAYHGGPGRIFELKLEPRGPTLNFIRKIFSRLPEENKKEISVPASCKISDPNEELREGKSGGPG